MRARRLRRTPLAMGVIAATLGVSAPAWAEWEGMRGIDPVLPKWTWEQLRAEAQRNQMSPDEAREHERIRKQGQEVGEQVGEQQRQPGREERRPAPRRGQGQISAEEMSAHPLQSASEHVRQARMSLQDNNWAEAASHLEMAETQIRRINPGDNPQVRNYLETLQNDMAQTRERLGARGRDAAGRLENIETRIRAMTPTETPPEGQPE